MPNKLSDKTYRYLTNMGVDIRPNAIVKSFNRELVEFASGESERVSALIWTAGVKGELIGGFGEQCITKQQRILVDEYNKVHGIENIFAIGDIAFMQIEKYSGGHPMVAQVAIQQGKNLAANIIWTIKKKPLRKFKYIDKGSMSTI
ncbi:MAG: FAD-dependent oxidoreductase [Bacteroidales bacterium]|nr:FAD-dependent oxidoreductase [Bacteroidales bacterium]